MTSLTRSSVGEEHHVASASAIAETHLTVVVPDPSEQGRQRVLIAADPAHLDELLLTEAAQSDRSTESLVDDVEHDRTASGERFHGSCRGSAVLEMGDDDVEGGRVGRPSNGS